MQRYSFWKELEPCQIVFILALGIFPLFIGSIVLYLSNNDSPYSYVGWWGIAYGIVIMVGMYIKNYYQKYYKFFIAEPKKRKKMEKFLNKKLADKERLQQEAQAKQDRILQHRKEALKNWKEELLDILIHPEKFNDPDVETTRRMLLCSWAALIFHNFGKEQIIVPDDDEGANLFQETFHTKSKSGPINGKLLVTCADDGIYLSPRVKSLVALASRKRVITDASGREIPVVALGYIN